MIERLRRVGLATLFVLGSVAVPSAALAVGTCTQNFLVGPYLSDNAQNQDILQASVQVNCPSPGRGGPKVQFQIVTTTNAVKADRITPICGSGCDYHHINAVAQSLPCLGHVNSTYRGRWRVWFDDKFGWEGWNYGPNRVVNCLR
jgi:hypothetical protein